MKAFFSKIRFCTLATLCLLIASRTSSTTKNADLPVAGQNFLRILKVEPNLMMPNRELNFRDLIVRIQQGDQEAASSIVKEFEPEVRRFVRFRLCGPSMRRIVDSLDICQSVFFRFFVGVREDRLVLNDPNELRKLLITMARNKVFDISRREHSGRRDSRRLTHAGDDVLRSVPSNPSLSPSEIVEGAEVWSLLLGRMTDSDRRLAAARLGGSSWEEIEREFECSSEALRKRLTRSIDRAAQELGLIE